MATSAPRTKWIQAAISAGLAMLFVTTCTAIHGVAADDDLLEWVTTERKRLWREENSTFFDVNFFDGLSGRLFAEILPETFLSDGGAYFFGTSNMASMLIPSELPAAEQEIIHNMAVPGAMVSDQVNLLRYMRAREASGAIRAVNTVVVFGLFFGNVTRNEDSLLPRIFPASVDNTGLYLYDRQEGLKERWTTGFDFDLRARMLRAGEFLRMFPRTFSFELPARLTVSPLCRNTRKPHVTEFYQSKWSRTLGPDWEANMANELESLAAEIDALGEVGVYVAGVVLPIGSWFRSMVQHRTFVRRTAEIFEDRRLPLVDLSELLEDEAYLDHAHTRYAGTLESQAALTGLALDWLEGRRTAPQGPLAPCGESG